MISKFSFELNVGHILLPFGVVQIFLNLLLDKIIFLLFKYLTT